MREKCQKLYKEAFGMYLAYNIDFDKYDKEIDESGLNFKTAKKFDKNLSSKYLIILNDMDIDNLSKEDLEMLKNSKNIDFDFIKMVSRTYKDVLRNGDNVGITLEFVTSENIITISKEEYNSIIEKQNKFISKIISQIKKDIESKLSIDCEIISNN